MATKLAVYNKALLLMKERRLAALTEDRESRRILDEVYDAVLQFCLEQGMWKFAMRRRALNSAAGAGQYGFTYNFDKPNDWVHLHAISEASDFDPPLVYNFVDEGSKLYANADPIYVRHTSSNASYGGDLTLWPQAYSEYVSAELAAWTSYAITGNERLAVLLEQQSKMKLANALALFGMVGLPGHLPMNTQARSVVGAEEVNLHPEYLPFGTEVRGILAQQQSQSDRQR